MNHLSNSCRYLTMAGITFLILQLGGCAAVGPNYRPEPPAHPAGWSTTESTHYAQEQELAHWWRLFNDPVLNQLVDSALLHNQDLAIARQRLLQARAERERSAGLLEPEINAGAETTTAQWSTKLDNAPTPARSKTYRLGLEASWEIDVFGGRRRSLEAADAQVQAVENDGRTILVSLLAELADDYAALRTTQQRMSIAQDNLAALTTAERLAVKAYSHGLGTAAEVAQARAEREINQARVPEFAGEAERLMHAIGVLIGDFPATQRGMLNRQEAALTVPPALPLSLPSEVVRRRPDIRAAERRLAAANAGIGVAIAADFPRFTIPLGLDTTASLLHQLFSAQSFAWVLSGSVQQSVYNGGKNNAAVQEARAEAEAQRLIYQQQVHLAFRDVENALSGLRTERLRHAALSAAERDSRVALTRATRLYRQGLSGYLPVLTAQRSAYQTRDALALNQLNDVQAMIGLYKALGAGW